MSTKTNNVTVVIRTAAERTAGACLELVLKQVPKNAVELVNERPFEMALKRSYEIGIECGTKWTMTLDADVLLRDGAIEKFISAAEAMPKRFVQIEGLVHDKLTGEFRPAGHRIYRTQYLGRALLQIPPPGTEIRPEYATLLKMDKLGFPSRWTNRVFGVHDYEQYYRDIYRKAFVHGIKHRPRLATMTARWKSLVPRDDDFRVALRGLCDGLMFPGVAKIDSRMYSEAAEAAIRGLELQEKSGLTKGSVDFGAIERILDVAHRDSTESSFRNKLREHHARIGTLRMMPFLAGIVLCRAGEFAKRIGYRHVQR